MEELSTLSALEAEELNRLEKAITEEIVTVAGVSRTTTCLSVDLS